MKTAPQQRSQMGQREVLQDPRHPELGIYRHRKTRGWNEAGAHLAQRVGHANTTACQDQSGRQSPRFAMGAVLRIPMGPEDAELGARSRPARSGSRFMPLRRSSESTF